MMTTLRSELGRDSESLVVLQERIAEILGPYFTVFPAEVYDIPPCAWRGLEEDVVNRKILILSDSSAALLAVKGYQVN